MYSIANRRSLLCFAVAGLAAAGRLPAQSVCPRSSLPAYSHNDYTNPRPLQDALSLGYQGVEADVFLVDGELRLGHDRPAAERGAAFESEYLAPLRELVMRCGPLTADGRPFLLDVEVKEESRPAFDTLVALVARYPDLFSPRGGNEAEGGPGEPIVDIVLVGWDPQALADASPVRLGRQLRLQRADGRAVETTDPAVRLISLDYYQRMGRWWMKVTPWRRRSWLSTLRAVKAASPTRRIRAYHVPVDEGVYRDLLAAGVDLIGTQNITATARLLSAVRR
ncbi:MAG TPA: hypothetical protein VIP11_02290 [Gemmatimonadaceae bacterium]